MATVPKTNIILFKCIYKLHMYSNILDQIIQTKIQEERKFRVKQHTLSIEQNRHMQNIASNT